MIKRIIFTAAVCMAALCAAQAMQCCAMTKKGERCKREAVQGEMVCFQHGAPMCNYRAQTNDEAKVHLPKSFQVAQERRAKQGPRAFSKAMRLKKYQEQGGKCPHCGGTFAFEQMEGDHIKPYSKGGNTEYSNLQMLCTPCNRKKSNKFDY